MTHKLIKSYHIYTQSVYKLPNTSDNDIRYGQVAHWSEKKDKSL